MLEVGGGAVEGDALEILAGLEEGFDVVFLDARKDDYERLFELARGKVEPGAVIVADNVVSHDARRLLAGAPGGRSTLLGHRAGGHGARGVRRAPPSPIRGLSDGRPYWYRASTAERRWSGR